MALIKDRKLAPDPWQLLEQGPDGAPPKIPATGDVIVPLATWQSCASSCSRVQDVLACGWRKTTSPPKSQTTSGTFS